MAKVTKEQLQAKLDDIREGLAELMLQAEVTEYNGNYSIGFPWVENAAGKTVPQTFTIAGFTCEVRNVMARIQGSKPVAPEADAKRYASNPTAAAALLETLAAQLGVKLPHKG